MNRHKRTLGLALAAASALCAGAQGASPNSARLVPANYNLRTDSLGFRWDINQQGVVGDGTNDCFDNGLALTVNGQRFGAQQAKMSPDGSELHLSMNLAGLQVTRRIKLHAKIGALRYVESFKNPSSAPVQAQVMVMSYLGGTAQFTVSDKGAMNPRMLGKKESAVVAVQQPGSGRPSVLFVLADARSKVKPLIQINNNRQYNFTYSLRVPPGQTVSILHSVAQRRIGALPQGKQLDKLFSAFRSSRYLRDLPSALRRSIVNGRGRGGYGSGFGQLAETLEALGVHRGTADVLALGEESRLHGTAACGALRIESRFGALEMPLDKVAAIVGGRRHGDQARLFLRDGQILRGRLTAKNLRFTMTTGATIPLEPKFLDRLVLREGPDDGKPAADVAGYVETFQGDRLALARDPDLRLTFAMPWGRRKVGFGELRWVKLAEEPEVGHRVALSDGSRFLGYLADAAVRFKTVSFGMQTFPAADIRTIASVDRPGGYGDSEEILDAHLILTGENVIVGRVDLPQIHFLAYGETIPIPPGQIRTLRNMAEGGDPEPGKRLQFSAEVWGGDVLAGELRENVLPVRTQGGLIQVALRDVVEINVPTPSVPDTLREKIAARIRDLGHPDWERREAASRQLGDLGYIARGQLEEALKYASDPEVRKRVKVLIESIKE